MKRTEKVLHPFTGCFQQEQTKMLCHCFPKTTNPQMPTVTGTCFLNRAPKITRRYSNLCFRNVFRYDTVFIKEVQIISTRSLHPFFPGLYVKKVIFPFPDSVQPKVFYYRLNKKSKPGSSPSRKDNHLCENVRPANGAKGCSENPGR